MRSGKTGLLGNTLDVDELQWVRFDASIGAGTDSFYEYLLKVAPRTFGSWLQFQMHCDSPAL